MSCSRCQHAFVIKPEVELSEPAFDEDEPDSDEPSDQGPTLRDHFEEDEDDLPTDERAVFRELDEDDYETAIEPSTVQQALQGDAAALHEEDEEDEEDIDTDVSSTPFSGETDAVDHSEQLPAKDASPTPAQTLQDLDDHNDIDGFQAIQAATFAAIDEELDDSEEDHLQVARNEGTDEEGGDEAADSPQAGFSIQVLAAKKNEYDTDPESEDEHTDEDDTDEGRAPISPDARASDKDPEEGNLRLASSAPPSAPSMASSDQPRATPIDAPENRAGSLPWLILLGVVALLLIYAFQFYSSPDAPSSGEPSAAPANPQQEAAEKEAAKPLELDIQSADEAP